MRDLVDRMYAEVARVAMALASPKRLEVIELLSQCEMRVETLSAQMQISLNLASSHLKVLREAGLVAMRKDGKFIYYRLADSSVASIWISLRDLAQRRSGRLQQAMKNVLLSREPLQSVDRVTIVKMAKSGKILLVDVRPEDEFAAGHLPYARSMPLAQLRKQIKEIALDVPVVAYCRGPFCMMAAQAVALMRKRAIHAFELSDGVAEWQYQGLPLEATSTIDDKEN